MILREYMPTWTNRHWTDELIIEELKALHERGVPMTCKGIGAADRVLFSAISLHFGSLGGGLKAAGLPMTPRERKWNREKVIAEIQRLHGEGADLSSSRIFFSDRRLYEAATKHCGSWSKAARLAGIPRSEYHRTNKVPKSYLSESEIIDGLRALHAQGVEMSIGGVGAADNHLYAAARRKFGDLRTALENAGLQVFVPPPRSGWTAESVIAEIQKLSAQGEDLSCRVSINTHTELANAAFKIYGTWSKALTSAGVDPEKVRRRPRQTDEELITELRRLHDNGEPVNAWALHQNHASLGSRLRVRFGSHNAALMAAGLDPALIRQKRGRPVSKR